MFPQSPALLSGRIHNRINLHNYEEPWSSLIILHDEARSETGDLLEVLLIVLLLFHFVEDVLDVFFFDFELPIDLFRHNVVDNAEDFLFGSCSRL